MSSLRVCESEASSGRPGGTPAFAESLMIGAERDRHAPDPVRGVPWRRDVGALRPRIAAFVVPVTSAERPSEAWAAADPMLTITPPPRWVMRGMQCLAAIA